MTPSPTTISATPEREILHFNLFWGLHGLLQLVSKHHSEFETVLDIGSGAGEHSRFLQLFGKKTFSLDLHTSADYVGDFMTCELDRKFDVIWCSHVLEHQRNIGAFLEKIYEHLNDEGLLAISVPVHPRERLISGHISSWNAGLLIYNLVLAGFDCSTAAFLQTFDLSLIVRKRPASGGDIRTPSGHSPIEDLAQYFPFPATFGGNAEVTNLNWNENYRLKTLGRPVTFHFNGGPGRTATIDAN